MADLSSTDLPYGHLGNGVYDPEQRTWNFQRSLSRSCRILTRLGDSFAKPSASRDQSSAIQKDDLAPAHVPSVRRQKQIESIVRRYPEVQPASALLRKLLEVSEAVETTTAHHDPARGQLFSIGRIFDESLRRTVRVAAFATGPTGSDLRIVPIQMQRQGWSDSRDIWLDVPVPAGAGVTYKGAGAPIQQVCFAEPLEGGEGLLAVRYITNTIIFRPVSQSYGPQSLKCSKILESSIPDVDGIPHSHVTFNPWFPRQFGLIDQSGNWAVYEFVTRQSSRIRRVHASTAPDALAERFNDGWARILWIAYPSVILVATRSSVNLCDIACNMQDLVNINLLLAKDSGRVLDVALVPSHADWLCVLTNSHICCVQVTKDKDDIVQAKVMLRIAMFRNQDDISVRMHISPDGPEFLVLIKSAAADVVTTYRMTIGDRPTLTMQDPSLLQMSGNLAGGVTKTFNLDMVNIEVRGKSGRDTTSTALQRYQTHGVRFLNLVMLLSDGTLAQYLYVSYDLSVVDLPDCLPEWCAKVEKSAAKLSDSFVVDDSDGDADIKTRLRLPMSGHYRHDRRVDRSSKEWTIHLSRCVRELHDKDVFAENIDIVLQQAHTEIAAPQDRTASWMQTLHDLAGTEQTVDDIDEATTMLMKLQQPLDPRPVGAVDATDEQSASLYVHALASHTLGVANPNVLLTDLASTYDSIVSEWVSPLTRAIPAPVRLAKEQLARRMAAELSLASHVLRPRDIEPSTQAQDGIDTQSRSQSQLHTGLTQFSETLPGALQSLSLLPTPSPTGTPSLSTQPSSFTAPDLTLLHKYTTLTKSLPPAPSRSINKILSHWPLGSDVSTYDWLGTSRLIAQQTEAEEADSQLTEKQRERLQRKAERHMRRQRREVEASQLQVMASSQMPVVASSQIPQLAVATGFAGGRSLSQIAGMNVQSSVMGSSQILGGGAASQQVSGEFGGKTPVRKKRRQGF